MSRTIGLLGLLGLLAAGTWWVLQREEPRGAVSASGVAQKPDESSEPVELVSASAPASEPATPAASAERAPRTSMPATPAPPARDERREEGGHVLSGVVTDGQGNPVPLFVVHWSEGAPSWAPETTRRCEDPLGFFSLDGLATASAHVYVSAEGFVDSEPQLVPLPSEELLLFTLHAPAQLVVAVLDPRGIQLQNAEVRWTRGPARFGILDSVVTDETGTATFPGLAPGEVVLSAHGSGYAPSETHVVALAEGEARREELVLRRPGTLTGEVRGADGMAVPGAKVSLRMRQQDVDGETTTDSASTFRFDDLPPGDAWVRARLGNGMAASKSVSLALGASEHVVLMIAATEPVKVTGRWLPALEEKEQIQVLFHARGESVDSYCKVQPDGTFEVLVPQAGEFDLMVMSSSVQDFTWRTSVTIPATPQHQLELRPPFAWIDGRVLARDGRPLSSVRVYTGGDWIVNTRTDADGRYRLRVLAGTTLVKAGGPDHEPRTRSWASARATVTLREGETSENVDFPLDAGGRLRGRVRLADGLPVVDTLVEIVSSDGTREVTSIRPDGRFELDGLPSGLLQVSARTMRDGRSGPAVGARIVADETSTVELELAPR